MLHVQSKKLKGRRILAARPRKRITLTDINITPTPDNVKATENLTSNSNDKPSQRLWTVASPRNYGLDDTLSGALNRLERAGWTIYDIIPRGDGRWPDVIAYKPLQEWEREAAEEKRREAERLSQSESAGARATRTN
jgi:hypothetical protein